MAGIYVHIPFCESRCLYCDFYSTTTLSCRTEYIDAVLSEYLQRREHITHSTLPKEPIKTLYIGGGTPSVLDIVDLHRLVDAIRNDLVENAEITMEANPGDLNEERLRALQDIGINRLSIGVQSFQNHLLHSIGRRHSAEEACNAVSQAQKVGFHNISIDLMYALPNETMNECQSDIDIALSLGVQHISCYCLTIESKTPLGQRLRRGEWQEIDDDIANAMFAVIREQLVTHGYEHYEVSNFAQTGYRSLHNSNYWNFTPYLGLGAAAHSFDGVVRSWNPNSLDKYIQGISNHTLVQGKEHLTREQHYIEQVMLGLRTAEGVSLSLLRGHEDTIQSLQAQGLVNTMGNRLVVTDNGINVLNKIIQDLL